MLTSPKQTLPLNRLARPLLAWFFVLVLDFCWTGFDVVSLSCRELNEEGFYVTITSVYVLEPWENAS